MSEYLEYGGLEEDAKELRKKVADFFQTDYEVLYDALHEVYEQGVLDTREKVAQEIEDYRVDRCRCEQTLEKDCDALIKVANIVMGKK